MKKNDVEEMVHTAYHEAGHAVVARAYHVGVSQVSIKPIKHSYGRIDWAKKNRPKSVFVYICILLAGEMSANLLLKTKINYDADGRKIKAQLNNVWKNKRIQKKYLADAKRHVKIIIKDNQIIISRIACFLLKHKEMTGKQLNDLIRSI